ncbi:SDR family NAD(P)-dependent oxidoreductase [Haloarcula amylovorans]|uniref:SDR family NAD(P)-dependent oxidoreductase n=1 Tax=Haloarcula amylovorans TaxID=2562280 RepID=UPI0010766E67|nr:SDR family NAD(P)-dependent oxidoreductase [Halomicroarcula amylolytica]
MGWLHNQTVFLTGGGSGLGRAIVERFVAEGANVVVLDVDEEQLQEIDADMTLSDSVVTVQGDVRSLEANERAVNTAVREFGSLDVFVGNAGVFDDNVTLPELPADDIETSFKELFGINVLGYLMGARAALPELVESEGQMVFTASQAGFNADGGGILYTPSKHAIVGIVRQLAFELAPRVRVNAVAPGYVPTDLSDAEALGGKQSIASADTFDASNHPLNIVPTPTDYTGAYVLLASPQNSRPMTGTIIQADLGRSIRGITEVSGRALEFVTADIET